MSNAVAERSFWERTVVGWHAACYGSLALVAVLVSVGEASTTARLATLALLAAFAAWYATAGRPALGADDNRLGLRYAAGATLLFAVLVQVTPAAFLLLFVLYPQTFAVLTLRPALAVVVVLTAVSVLAQIADSGWSADAAVPAVLSGLGSIGLAALLGFWITGIIRESDQRAQLLAELEGTRAELAAANREAGTLAERQRLAHEIHDTLAQGFTSILMLLEAADAAIDTDPTAAHRRLAVARNTARANLAEARSLVAAMTPVDLQTGSLPEAVRRLTTRFGEELGIVAEVAVTGSPRPLPARVEVVLLRAVQESLANVRKHAAAGQVRVRLAYDDAVVGVEVSDDGRGFATARDGFGLAGMRTRVEDIGGHVAVRSTSGAGTTVVVEVPT